MERGSAARIRRLGAAVPATWRRQAAFLVAAQVVPPRANATESRTGRGGGTRRSAAGTAVGHVAAGAPAHFQRMDTQRDAVGERALLGRVHAQRRPVQMLYRCRSEEHTSELQS